MESADVAESVLRSSLPQLGHLLEHLVEHRGRLRPVEAHTRGPLLQLLGAQQGREGQRHTVQHAGRAPFRQRPGVALGRLLRLPGPGLPRGRAADIGFFASEDVGMAANHLLGDAARDRVEVEAAVFARHLRVEDDLEQQVAELVAERRPVVLTDRLGHLVGFLDGVRRNRLEALFEVPRAAARRIAQPGHHVEQLIDAGGQRAGRVVVVPVARRWRVTHRSGAVVAIA